MTRFKMAVECFCGNGDVDKVTEGVFYCPDCDDYFEDDNFEAHAPRFEKRRKTRYEDDDDE